MDAEEQSLLAANVAFYRALGNQNLRLMSTVWAHCPEATFPPESSEGMEFPFSSSQ